MAAQEMGVLEKGTLWLKELPGGLSLSRLSLSIATISSKCLSNACKRKDTVQMETHMAPPKRMRSHSRTCCHVVIWLKLTVLRPASVMAETARNRLSI